MNRKHILSLLAATLLTATVSLLTACRSDDDDTTVPNITPEATGEFTDDRDGNVYHYVTYGGLDWTVENATPGKGPRRQFPMDGGCLPTTTGRNWRWHSA